MKLVLLGAASEIGRELAAQALARGHHVTAVARRPEELGIDHPGLVRLHGDLLDGASLQAALREQGAACSVFRIQRGGGQLLLAEGMGNLIQAMHAAGVRRLVVLDPVANIYPDWMEKFFIREAALAERMVITRLIHSSDLDRTIIHAGRLASRLQNGTCRMVESRKAAAANISRIKLASCLVSELEEGRHLRRSVWTSLVP